ncbi:DinB family protein [Crossiella sp. SN42]|uniref:DinB family protein n=1 Tax=Crossiella sp. SN42 TaxID=2944808 RepID=UPI00207CFA9E|nr:DinB family protein [Crossiella sp. SN42]MCO1578950.1 DinB family protein [Crossiella sp. SN42]
MTSSAPISTDTTLTGERADLLEALGKTRFFLRHTAQGLTDEQANKNTTVSELTIAKLIKHVANTEKGWVDFILEGPSAMAIDETDWAEAWHISEAETLEVLLARYAEIAERTDELIASLPSLDLAHPLPEAPWFEPGTTWSARRVFAHLIAETAQHAGHADIIRESLDGQKSMG